MNSQHEVNNNIHIDVVNNWQEVVLLCRSTDGCWLPR
jgi:hypothetical protein